jgi:hypothetical protein
LPTAAPGSLTQPSLHVRRARLLVFGILDGHSQLDKLYFQARSSVEAQKSFQKGKKLGPKCEIAQMIPQKPDLLKKSGK